MPEVKDTHAALQKIEALIKGGDLTHAQALVKNISQQKPDRQLRLRLAALARRVNLNQTAVRLLNPIVRPSLRKVGETATGEELIEYAASLIRLGASQEAFDILSSVDRSKFPQALLFLSIAYITKWNYEAAVPLLREYIGAASLSPYERTVGEVNLLSALVHERRHEEAVPLMQKLYEDANRNDLKFVKGKLLYIEAELEINRRNFEVALARLRSARELLTKASANDLLFLQTWEAIANLAKAPNSKEALKALHNAKQEAIRLRHWETIRNCDLHEALLCKNDAIATHLYFGTPYPAYRQYLIKHLGKGLSLPETYHWKLGSKASPQMVDLEDKEKSDGYLSSRRPMYQLFRTLSSDFYAPFKLVELHSLVFVNEFFNPSTSPERVRKAIHRMRVWFKEHKLPLKLVHEDHTYKLGGEVTILIRRERATSENKRMLDIILEKKPGPFSASEATLTLKCGRRTVNRLLEELTKEGVLERTGNGPAVRYKKAS